MALGWLSVLGQLAGAGMNMYLGHQQRQDGEDLAEQGRLDLLATAGPTDALLSSVDEQKRLVTKAGDLGQERLDQSVTSLLDALASGDPSAYHAIPGFGANLATASQDMGLKTASNLAIANQPAVDAAESEMNVHRGLAQFDMEQGLAAYNAGTQTMYGGIGQVLGIPTDMASLQVANPDAYSQLFPNSNQTQLSPNADQGIKTKNPKDEIEDLKLQIEKAQLEKELTKYASGGIVYGGEGINMRTLVDILDGLDQGNTIIQENYKEEEVEEPVVEEENTEDNYEVDEEKKRQVEEEIERRRRESKHEGKYGIKTESYIGGGNTISQLLGPGQSFKTGGKEDHDAQEYNIEDAKTGEIVAKTTGQETHMVNEDGTLTVMNSEQTQSVHDAFKNIDIDIALKALKNNPQKKGIRSLLSALNKVFSQQQFKS